MKNRLLNILRAVISVLLLVFLFYRLNLGDIKPLLRTVAVPYLILSFAGYLLLLLFSTTRWWWLLKEKGVRLPFIKVFAYYLIGMFFNNFLPPTIGGGAVRALFAGRDTNRSKETFASMSCELLLGLIGLFIFVTLLLLFYLHAVEGRVLFIIFLSGSIGLIVLFYLMLSPVMVSKLEGYIKRIRIFGIGNKLFDFYTALSSYRDKKRAIFVGIILSFGVQTAIGIQNFFIARSLHLDIGLLPCIIFPSIISVIIMIPSIGGLGVREASYVYFFNMLGISKEASFSLSLIFYLVGVVGSLPGAVIFPLMRRVKKEDKQ